MGVLLILLAVYFGAALLWAGLRLCRRLPDVGGRRTVTIPRAMSINRKAAGG